MKFLRWFAESAKKKTQVPAALLRCMQETPVPTVFLRPPYHGAFEAYENREFLRRFGGVRKKYQFLRRLCGV